MTDNGVAALAERLRYVDFKNWDADEVAERVTLNGSRFLSREAAERQEAIEEAARDLINRGSVDTDDEIGAEFCHYCDGGYPKHSDWCDFAALERLVVR